MVKIENKSSTFFSRMIDSRKKNNDVNSRVRLGDFGKVLDKSDVISLGKRFQIALLLLFFAGFIYDVFFIVPAFTLVSDIRLFSLLLLWIFLSKISGFNSMATLKVLVGFLLVMFFLFISSQTNPVVERVGSWVYMFLLMAIIQQLSESRKRVSRQK